MSASSSSATSAPKSRGKRLLQNLVLAGGVFLLCFVVCELALRLAGYGNLEIYEPDPKLYWRLKPNQDCFTKVDRQPVRINSQGTRGAEFSVAKPAGTFRILSLGDSRTFGWGLAEEDTYSGRLGQLLKDFQGANIEFPTSNIQRPITASPLTPSEGERENLRRAFGVSKRVEVINAGVNAWSFAQMAVYFREFGLRYQPDLVVVGEANLWTQFSEKSDPEFVRKFLWRVRLKNFLRRFALYHFVVEVKLRDFYERHRTKFIPVDPAQDTLFQAQQQGDPDASFRDAITELCRLARSNGVQPVLLFLPRLDELEGTNQNAGRRAKTAVSTALNVPLCDVTPRLRAAGNPLYLEADPVHFNRRGNEIVAQGLFETVTNLFAP
jgi:lysophospholipase L1-like esterase